MATITEIEMSIFNKKQLKERSQTANEFIIQLGQLHKASINILNKIHNESKIDLNKNRFQ